MPLRTPVESAPHQREFTGWHFLAWIGAFFGFMFVVNGIFLWKALSSFPGEDVSKAYTIGLRYNEEIAARALQEALGWTAEIGLAEAAGPPVLLIRLRDADALALSADALTVQLRHPANSRLDHLLEPAAGQPGEYTAALQGISPGLWTVRIFADVPHADGTARLLAEREIMLR
jgi:nitrogen fixation protein FixH